MKIRRTIALFAAMGVLVVTALFMHTGRPVDKNSLPTLSPRGGEANSSTEYLNAQRAAQYYRDEIRKKPDEVKNYVELAQIFLHEARVTANHHEYIPKARLVLEEALRRDPENLEALVTRASMLMTLHQFAQAREILENVSSKNPYNAACFNTMIDAYVELGDYEHAVSTCDKLMSIRPDLRGYARVSYLREMHGDNFGAREAMKMAADAGIRGQEQRSWALYNLGSLYLREGKLDTAEFIFKGTLEERPDYPYALSGLAQVRFDHGRNDDAIELLTKALEIAPEHLFMEQLVAIYRTTGQAENATKIAKLVLQSFEQHDRDGWNVDREYALFCADNDMNLPEALQRAKREYERRPNNIDASQTYAWLLYKNGFAHEAVPYIEQAMHLHSHSALLEYRAGAIFNAAGEGNEAKLHLRQALSIDPFISGLYAHEAQKALASLRTLAANN